MNPRGTVAVTGATGFLGRALVAALLAAGDSVVALARPSTDKAQLPEHDRLRWVGYERDLTHPDVVAELASTAPTGFVHLGWAGVAGPTRGDVDHVAVNVPTTIASVQLAAASGCSYWLGIGSQAEYGPSVDVLTEDSALRPVTGYGLAKVAAGAAAHAVGSALDVTTGWARVFSVYGPGDHEGAVLPYAIRELLAGSSPNLGSCAHDWDLLHIDDAAAALAALVHREVGGAVNLASGRHQPLREAIDLAAAQVGGPAQPDYGEAEGVPLRASVARLEDTTGWRPRVSLPDGVAGTVEHLRQSVLPRRSGVTK